jgi:hypothetical protein
VQDYLTREVVWDPVFGGSANNLAFRFTSLNLKESLQRGQIAKLALAGIPWRTIDEQRLAEGREPIGGEIGDKLVMATSVGAVTLDDVPSAREALEARRGATGASASSPPVAAKPPR